MTLVLREDTLLATLVVLGTGTLFLIIIDSLRGFI